MARGGRILNREGSILIGLKCTGGAAALVEQLNENFLSGGTSGVAIDVTGWLNELEYKNIVSATGDSTKFARGKLAKCVKFGLEDQDYINRADRAMQEESDEAEATDAAAAGPSTSTGASAQEPEPIVIQLPPIRPQVPR